MDMRTSADRTASSKVTWKKIAAKIACPFLFSDGYDGCMTCDNRGCTGTDDFIPCKMCYSYIEECRESIYG